MESPMLAMEAGGGPAALAAAAAAGSANSRTAAIPRVMAGTMPRTRALTDLMRPRFRWERRGYRSVAPSVRHNMYNFIDVLISAICATAGVGAQMATAAGVPQG